MIDYKEPIPYSELQQKTIYVLQDPTEENNFVVQAKYDEQVYAVSVLKEKKDFGIEAVNNTLHAIEKIGAEKLEKIRLKEISFRELPEGPKEILYPIIYG